MKKRYAVIIILIVILNVLIFAVFSSSANSYSASSAKKTSNLTNGNYDTNEQHNNDDNDGENNNSASNFFSNLLGTNKDVDKLVKDTATNWAKETKPSLSLTVDNISKIYCDNSNQIEYCVSYYNDKTPYGYSIVTFVNEEAVVKESRIDSNVPNLRSTILTTIPDFSNNSNLVATNSLIELNSLQYAVAIYNKRTNKTVLHDNYGENYDTDIINDLDDANNLANEIKTGYNAASNISKEKINVSSANYSDNDYKLGDINVLEKYKNRNNLFTEKYVEQINKKYCCVISALTQIAYFEEFLDNNNQDYIDTYNNLWNMSNIKTIKTNNNIVYGGGQFDNAINAFVDYAKSKGKTNTSAERKSQPNMEWLTSKIKKNNPVYFRYSILVKEHRAGHAISILGTLTTKKEKTNNSYDYIIIYDSWRKTPAFINYSLTSLKSCHGASFDVK